MPRQLPWLLGSACALGLACSALAGEATPRNALLATSKGNHTLAIIDPSSDKIIAKMPIGPDPHEVIASEDGKTAYVSNMGGNSSLHRIDVLDLVGQRALEPIDTAALTGLHGLAVSPGKLWFTAQGAMAIARLDMASRQVDWIMGTGQTWTHMLVLTPDLKHIYTSNVRAGSVSLFDLQPVSLPPAPPGAPRPPTSGPPPQEWVHTVVPTERGTEGVDLSPDGKEIWTASSGSGQIYVIDTAARKVAQVLDAKAVGANRLKFTHDGKRVLISSLRSGDLLVYDAKARTQIKRLRLGTGCAGVLVAPDDTRAYVACSSDNAVFVLDMHNLKTVDHIDVGPNPDGLAWASLH
ncbi:MAG TPA: cytochrome D1 domain-containing protein [Steroidobacteraceae bacterium]|nr:cytochrome D1 domain-containing protein [Steroidobacteraceae bacterium]